MAVSAGGFIWYELTTHDAAAAQAFYAKVVGWTMADAGMANMTYTLAKAGDHQVAGLMDIPPGMDWPAAWMGHILVADVDAMAERVTQAGGTVHRGATEIPGVGRFAVVSDPQGAGFLLFQAHGGSPPGLAPGAPGGVGWHELHARDWEAAWGFYEGLFGWEKSMAVDMGPMGTYQTFNVAGVWTGGMMSDSRAATPYWAYYFTVDDIQAAAERVSEAGGKLMHGPMQVPGGSWVLQAMDPQGVAFTLTTPKLRPVLTAWSVPPTQWGGGTTRGVVEGACLGSRRLCLPLRRLRRHLPRERGGESAPGDLQADARPTGAQVD